MPKHTPRIEATGAQLRALLESAEDPDEFVEGLEHALSMLAKDSPNHPIIRELGRSLGARASDELQRAVLHDIKNMLNLVALNLELTRPKLATTLGASEGMNIRSPRTQTILSLLQALDDAQVLSDQACRLSLSTLDLTQPHEANLDDLGSVLELCARASERVLRGRLEIHLVVEAVSMVSVRAGQAELFRVVLNLLQNASEAQVVKGTARIRAWKTDEMAFVEVEDDGPGIPAELQDSIFEAFVTSKTQRGGLGLFTVKQIVDQWGGEIQLASQPGCTRLTFSIPRS